MSLPAIDTETLQPAPSSIDVLELRAWARAYLWWAGLIETISEAVDPLQDFAERSGLDAYRTQQILADQFAPFRKGEL
jgi:hypothetical protein